MHARVHTRMPTGAHSHARPHAHATAPPTFHRHSPEHERVKTIGWSLLLIWPVGVPLIYAALLFYCRKRILGRMPAPITRAIGFLHHDFRVECFWWELVDQLRKLVLVGWLLLIDERFALIRLLISLVVCLLFLGLTPIFQPYRKSENNMLSAGMHLGLVFAYMAACFMKVHQSMTEVFIATGTPGEVGQKVKRVMSIDSDSFAYVMVGCSLMLLLLVGTIAAQSALAESKIRTIRDRSSGRDPLTCLNSGRLKGPPNLSTE